LHTYTADGPYTVTVHVADDGGSTADATSYVVVYEYANQTGGAFVVGDGGGGPQVYFWGSQWAAQNPIRSGNAPDSFKGFADDSAQSCGATFGSRPGNSSAPPATVPPYMAVAVASAVSKSGSRISGTIEKIVVVKTDPGYAPDPGSPGAGRVVATICG
jgi:PKD repeat protein